MQYLIEPCNSTDNLCKNGRCVSSSSVCNYYNDCGDNSDEFGCRKFFFSIPTYAFLKVEILSNSCNKLLKTQHA